MLSGDHVTLPCLQLWKRTWRWHRRKGSYWASQHENAIVPSSCRAWRREKQRGRERAKETWKHDMPQNWQHKNNTLLRLSPTPLIPLPSFPTSTSLSPRIMLKAPGSLPLPPRMFDLMRTIHLKCSKTTVCAPLPCKVGMPLNQDKCALMCYFTPEEHNHARGWEKTGDACQTWEANSEITSMTHAFP